MRRVTVEPELHRKLPIALQALRDLLRLVGPHRRALLLMLTASVAVTGAELALLVVTLQLLSNVLGAGSFLPSTFRWAHPGLEQGSNREAVLTGALAVALVLLVRQLLVALQRTLSHSAVRRIVTHVRAGITSNLLAARFAFLDRLQTGTPRQLIVGEVQRVGSAVRALAEITRAAISSVMLLTVLVLLSVPLTLAVAAVLVLAWPLKAYVGRLVYRLAASNVQAHIALMNQLNEMLLGIRQIKLAGREQEFLEQSRRCSAEVERIMRRIQLLGTWEPLLTRVLLVAGGIMIVEVWMLAGATVDALAAYALVLSRTLPQLGSSMSSLNGLVATKPSLEYLMSYLPLPPSDVEPRGGRVRPDQRVDRIALEEVSLGYGEGRDALAGVSLEARAGEIVALVGESGSGKSSVLQLLLGMYTPRAGRVLVDRDDVSALDLGLLRRLIGVVTQDVHLFDTNLFELIRGGRSELGMADVAVAAREAEAEAFIAALPAGWATVVGEHGVRVSGGERQRLLLAQIYARRTPVVLLDEFTSALDQLTEARLFETLYRNRANRVTLLATHRLANLRWVDRIYVLERGRVVEAGSYAELMACHGVLWRMSRREQVETTATTHAEP